MTVVYDTGALVAAERSVKRMWAIHGELADGGGMALVPVVVLAQAWRGGPQAQLSRLLSSCELEPVTERVARAAGVACAASRTSDVIDAIVVVRALELGAPVVTSDADDLLHIADALRVRLDVVTV